MKKLHRSDSKGDKNFVQLPLSREDRDKHPLTDSHPFPHAKVWSPRKRQHPSWRDLPEYFKAFG